MFPPIPDSSPFYRLIRLSEKSGYVVEEDQYHHHQQEDDVSLEGQVVNGVLPTPLQDLVVAGQDTHRILMSSGTGPGP